MIAGKTHNCFKAKLASLASILGRGGVKCASAATFLALLYVLSCAPAALFAKNHPACMPAFARLYVPISWLHNHTPLKKPLEAYGRLWGFD
jgi:hypothetical protein